ncbi:MAG: hypothetical protein WBA31_07575 [Candidatus Dormiibacterota bacterium]
MDRVCRQILDRRPGLAPLAATFVCGFTEAHRVGNEASHDIEIAERLANAYRRAIAEGPDGPRPEDMWTNFAGQQSEVAGLLRSGAPLDLVAYLRALPRKAGGHGFWQGAAAFEQLQSDPAQMEKRALWFMDNLISMAEAVGVLSVRCPEQANFDSAPAEASADEVRHAIEARIGLPVSLPPVFDGLFTLEPLTGPMHLRTIVGAYAIDRLAHFIESFAGIRPGAQRVAEIGAGIGFTAYVAHRLGMSAYSLFDLPEVNAAQGYFLLKTLPSDEVGLYGEPERGQKVWVRPTFAFDTTPSSAFDAVMNIDSLPEIAPPEARRYLARIPHCSKWFFSINQEAQAPQTALAPQSVVRQLVSEARGYRPVLRSPNWIRTGYVDEIWRCQV